MHHANGTISYNRRLEEQQLLRRTVPVGALLAGRISVDAICSHPDLCSILPAAPHAALTIRITLSTSHLLGRV